MIKWVTERLTKCIQGHTARRRYMNPPTPLQARVPNDHKARSCWNSSEESRAPLRETPEVHHPMCNCLAEIWSSSHPGNLETRSTDQGEQEQIDPHTNGLCRPSPTPLGPGCKARVLPAQPFQPCWDQSACVLLKEVFTRPTPGRAAEAVY